MGVVSRGCWWLGVGFFVVVLWVGFFPFLVMATSTASGSLFSVAFFFPLFVLISVGGSLGWYSFLWLVRRLFFSLSTATIGFVLFVSFRFFQDLYCWVNFFRADPVPASAPLWAGCWVSPPVNIVWSVVALVSGWWVFLVAVPVTSRGVVASVSVPYFLVVMVAVVVASVVLVVWIRSWVVWVVGSFLVVMVAGVVASVFLVVWIGSWAGLGSFLVDWVVGSFRCSIFWCWVSLGAGS